MAGMRRRADLALKWLTVASWIISLTTCCFSRRPFPYVHAIPDHHGQAAEKIGTKTPEERKISELFSPLKAIERQVAGKS